MASADAGGIVRPSLICSNTRNFLTPAIGAADGQTRRHLLPKNRHRAHGRQNGHKQRQGLPILPTWAKNLPVRDDCVSRQKIVRQIEFMQAVLAAISESLAIVRHSLADATGVQCHSQAHLNGDNFGCESSVSRYAHKRASVFPDSVIVCRLGFADNRPAGPFGVRLAWTEQHRRFQYMPDFAYHRMIVGYHGCDRATIEAALLRGEQLRPSVNEWDWLGHGIYFWEHGPHRAYEFAREQQSRGIVNEPAVIGAYIHLGRCFDLTDRHATQALADFFPAWLADATARGNVPKNKRAKKGDTDFLLRYRDCKVLNDFMDGTDAAPGLTPSGESVYYQTVRGVFVEGEPVYEDAGIFTKTHIQIAVRDVACILGYFLPANRGWEAGT